VTCQLCNTPNPLHQFERVRLQGFRGLVREQIALCDAHFELWIESRSLRMSNDELTSALTNLLGVGLQ
jgi:hypothetical protein